MPAGRPTKCTPALLKKAENYLEKYETGEEEGDQSIVGMARVLKVNKSTLPRWVEDKEHEFCDTLERCNNLQEEILINKGLIGDFNSSMAQRMLINHGYHDKQVSEITGAGGQPLIPHNAPMVEYVDAKQVPDPE